MKIKYTINELLFKLYIVCAITGGILRFTIGKWEPIYDTYTFVSQGNISTLFNAIAGGLIFILMLRCNIRYQRKVPQKFQVLGVFLMVYFIAWTIISLGENSIQDVFIEEFATTIILLPMCFTIGYDNRIFCSIKNSIYCISIVFSITFYATVFSFWQQYGIKWPTNASYKGIFSYWITSVWVFTFIYIHDKSKRKKIYIMISLVTLGAFITQSRAWVIQSLMLLLIAFSISGKRNKKFKVFIGILVVFILVLGISYLFPEITGSLVKRGIEDTRSGQYIVFFEQHSIEDLIFGMGLNATYCFLGESKYRYFDNQFMFIMFHYGVLPVISWLIVYFSVFTRNKTLSLQRDDISHAAKLIGGFALLAYMGLSTYYQISFGYSSVLILIVLGKAICNENERN